MGKKWIRILVISIKFTKKINEAKFSKSFVFFLLNFMLKLDEPFRNQEIFIIPLFSIVESKFFFVDILSLGSGSVDPHIFEDPDPKHCLKV